MLILSPERLLHFPKNLPQDAVIPTGAQRSGRTRSSFFGSPDLRFFGCFTVSS
jgi:hypothetical protein